MVLRFAEKTPEIGETETSSVLLQEVSKTFGETTAIPKLNLEVKKGEFFSLMGPSGCGKTTVLRLIAGLEAPDEGSIVIGNAITGKMEVAGSVWVQPEKRGIGLVFQDYALFPHMTVSDNVGFGLIKCGGSKRKQKVMELLDMIGLLAIAQRYPHELSGGQQQRVALARAMAPAPQVMLLDEPFSNLDADLRMELRAETKRILKTSGTTAILVTHDQAEAFSLSDRIGLLNHGRLEQVGTPDEIYHRPLTRFVARFAGRADFVAGRVEGDLVVSVIGNFPLEEPLDPAVKRKLAEVEIMIRPDDVAFVVDPQGAASLLEAEFTGSEIIYKIMLQDGKMIHAIRSSTSRFEVGCKINVEINPEHLVVFAA